MGVLCLSVVVFRFPVMIPGGAARLGVEQVSVLGLVVWVMEVIVGRERRSCSGRGRHCPASLLSAKRVAGLGKWEE